MPSTREYVYICEYLHDKLFVVGCGGSGGGGGGDGDVADACAIGIQQTILHGVRECSVRQKYSVCLCVCVHVIVDVLLVMLMMTLC